MHKNVESFQLVQRASAERGAGGRIGEIRVDDSGTANQAGGFLQRLPSTPVKD